MSAIAPSKPKSAALLARRRGRRRATYKRNPIREARMIRLPLTGVLAGSVGLVALTLALCGAAWWL